MAGIGHRGMFRKKAGGFRYLHDEISRGTRCYSHLRCLSSYGGYWGSISAIPYGFLNNFAVLPNLGLGTKVTANFFDQLEIINSTNNSSSYSDIVHDWSSAFITYPAHSPINTDTPFSYLCVYNPRVSTRDGDEIGIRVGNATAGTGRGACMFLNLDQSLEIRVRRRGTLLRKIYNGVLNSDVPIMFVWNYDGSEDISGLSLYINGSLATPDTVSGTTIPNESYSGAVAYLYYSTAANSGLMLDTHMFSSPLSGSEIETAKEILEQYYTFS